MLTGYNTQLIIEQAMAPSHRKQNNITLITKLMDNTKKPVVIYFRENWISSINADATTFGLLDLIRIQSLRVI